MIRDANAAVAASICWLARWGDYTLRKVASARHPKPCDWCQYPKEGLMAMIEEFNQADASSGGRLSASFVRLSPNAQRSLVDAAMYSQR